MPSRTLQPSIDRDALRAVTGGDASLEAELAQVMLEDLPARRRLIDAALILSDFETATREAHGLKGACMNLGATAMADVARRIEHAAKIRDSHSARVAFVELRLLEPRLVAALRSLAVGERPNGTA